MRKPVLCLLGRHRDVWRTNPDGGRYQQCSRCGRDAYRSGTQPGAGITGGMHFGGHGF